MSDTEYEYDSPNDSDEEIVGYQSYWQEMQKRIHCTFDEIHIRMEENDATSVFHEIINAIRNGVSCQFIVVQLQIEHIHNAIINNPTKRKGPQRLNDIKRLQKLLNPNLFLKHIQRLNISNAEDYQQLTYMPNLKKLTVKNPTNALLSSLCSFKRLTTLSIEDIASVPPLYHIKSLKTLTITNMKRFRDVTAIRFSNQDVDVHIRDSTVWPADAILMSMASPRTTLTNIQVIDGKTKTYDEWREGNKKPIIF
jgi:hypothetical protein